MERIKIDGIEIEQDIAYLRILTDGKTWTTHKNMSGASISGNCLYDKNGKLLLAFTEDGRIKLNYGGHYCDNDGWTIYDTCTTIYTKQEDGTYTDGNGSVVTKKDAAASDGYCTDKNGISMLWEAMGEDDSQIHVWTTTYENFLIRNFLQFDVSESEIVNTYQNENGNTILYPIRQGKRKINLQIETDLSGLAHLKEYFNQPELIFFYKSPADAEEQGGIFRKTSDIQTNTVKKGHSFDNNPIFGDAQMEDIGFSKPITENEHNTGIYELSISLEEI